jgi:hypothetical protein
MRNAQRGVSIMGLLMALVLFIIVALFAMKLLPSFMEFRTAKTAIEIISKQAQNANDVRRAWDARAAIDNITSVSAKDLEITRDGNQVVIAFAYRTEVRLFGPVGLYIDYAARSNQ